MALIITVLAFCLTVAGVVLVCFYAPCLRDHLVSAKREARTRRRWDGAATELATVTAEAEQQRGVDNPMVPPDYTEEEDLAGGTCSRDGAAPVVVPTHQSRCGRPARPHYLATAGRLRLDAAPPTGYGVPQWRRPPAPGLSAWQPLDPALWLLHQTGWSPSAAGPAAQCDPPPEYSEAGPSLAPTDTVPPATEASLSRPPRSELGAPPPEEACEPQPQPPPAGAAADGAGLPQSEPALPQPLTPRQFQCQWERLGAVMVPDEPPPPYSPADPRGISLDMLSVEAIVPIRDTTICKWTARM
ncbi:extensin-like [Amphibalanus amphitrite]|uniref:extensin-like n=1 Tax=Amphibalanus amphitrite TaxID=1232801 RepID=UPI001C9050A9|nr:extensin-like [Amphibalanus amphitrite]